MSKNQIIQEIIQLSPPMPNPEKFANYLGGLPEARVSERLEIIRSERSQFHRIPARRNPANAVVSAETISFKSLE